MMKKALVEPLLSETNLHLHPLTRGDFLCYNKESPKGEDLIEY